MITRWVWELPGWLHGALLALTGWRVVAVTRTNETSYRWSRRYPL